MEQKKKILFLIHDISNAGIEKVCLNLISKLNNKNNIDLYLYEPKDSNEFDDQLPTNIKIFKGEKRCGRVLRFINILFWIINYVRNYKPDIIVTFLPYTTMIVFFINLFFRFKHIATQHNLLTNDIGLLRGAGRIYNSIILKFVFRRIKHFIVVSNSIKQDLIDNFRVEENKIEVIYNSVNYDLISELYKEKIAEPISNYILFVGRLEKQKAIDVLIKAFAELLQCGKKYEIIILGQGSLENDLKSLAAELKCLDKIHFLGFRSNPYKYMRSAACLVLPSIFEGFGCVIPEAMVCKTPVIASNIEGPKEIIENNINGFLFLSGNERELANKIVQVYENRNLVDAVVSKANETVKQYINLENKYEAYFNQVLNEEKTYEA
jgi:glycosyltransferase involved in cell wall biosynthesis